MGGYQTRETGSSAMWKLDISRMGVESKRERRVSGVSKVSSVWSIQGSSGMLASNDKILVDDGM